MKVRVTLTTADGPESVEWDAPSRDDLSIINMARNMLDSVTYLSVGDSLTVEEVRS